MTRDGIERELFKDQCAISYPSVSREVATAYVENFKPIAEQNYKREATRLYDDVVLRYGRLIWGPLLAPDQEVDRLKRLVRDHVDPFEVAPADHDIVLALGTDNEAACREALRK